MTGVPVDPYSIISAADIVDGIDEEPGDYDYDLFVIGSGPAGQRAAIQAAKLGKRVGLAEERASVGGVSINVGTIPSKSLREAVVQVSAPQHSRTGAPPVAAQDITMADLLGRVNRVVENEVDVTGQQLVRNGVDVVLARATFGGSHTLHLNSSDGRLSRTVGAHHIVIATGSRATEDPHIPFDRHRVFTSDDVPGLDRVPRTLTVVGAGVIGVEYASMFAALGVRVTLIDKHRELLPFIDAEITAALAYQLRRNRVILRLGEDVTGMEVVRGADGDGEAGGRNGHGGDRVLIQLASGKQIVSQKALYSVGRTGNTAGLELAAAGLRADERGRLAVNKHYQTEVPHIYAVGDVVGFPALAATSMEQGRLAAAHAFGAVASTIPELLPYGIYTVPEISMVGHSEQELTEAGTPYEVGIASYREIARGQILGDQNGLLKLIFHLETRKLLGVHIIGHGATELVHIGQAVMALDGDADYFVNTVFNYPTLAECYKTAAFDAINRMADIYGSPGALAA